MEIELLGIFMGINRNEINKEIYMNKNLIKLIVFFGIFVFSFSAFSMKIGLKSGMNMSGSRISGDSSINEEDWTGLSRSSFGLLLRFDISQRLTLQPEIFYVMKGIKRIEEVPTGYMQFISVMHMWRFHYIELPVLLRIKFAPKSELYPVAFTGPYFAYLINNKWKHEFSLGGDISDIWNETDTLKRFDYGIVFGVGAEFRQKVVTIMFEIRYTLGLTNVASDTNAKYTDIKNSCFAMQMGFSF